MEHLELIKHLCFPTMWNETYISVYVNLVNKSILHDVNYKLSLLMYIEWKVM